MISNLSWQDKGARGGCAPSCFGVSGREAGHVGEGHSKRHSKRHRSRQSKAFNIIPYLSIFMNRKIILFSLSSVVWQLVVRVRVHQRSRRVAPEVVRDEMLKRRRVVHPRRKTI